MLYGKLQGGTESLRSRRPFVGNSWRTEKRRADKKGSDMGTKAWKTKERKTIARRHWFED